MAALAVVAEFAAMDIVAAVAIGADRTEFGRIAGARVARSADQPLVLAGEREAGLGVVIETPRLPVTCRVAIAAFGGRAEPALVMFVDMAIGALRPLDRKGLVSVAIGAFQRRVLAQQWEAGQRVVEADVGRPVVGIVAAAARRAELGLVDVVLIMAGRALRYQLHLVRGLDMAILAARLRVFPQQREAGHGGVVEFHRLPIGFGMAARAIGPVAALVAVVFLVTAEAGGRRGGNLRRLGMAAFAARLTVRAAQGEVGKPVVIELDARPALRNMAIRALRPVCALVAVVLLVAAVAGRRRVLDRIVRPVA